MGQRDDPAREVLVHGTEPRRLGAELLEAALLAHAAAAGGVAVGDLATEQPALVGGRWLGRAGPGVEFRVGRVEPIFDERVEVGVEMRLQHGDRKKRTVEKVEKREVRRSRRDAFKDAGIATRRYITGILKARAAVEHLRRQGSAAAMEEMVG